MPITSSAASETLSARKRGAAATAWRRQPAASPRRRRRRAGARRAARRRAGAAATAATASSTSAASPTTSTRRRRARRARRRGTSRGRRRSRPSSGAHAVVLSVGRGSVQPHLGALARGRCGRRRCRRGAPSGRGCCCARRAGRRGRVSGSKPGAAVADEDLDLRRRRPRRRRRPASVPACLAALTIASRAASTSGAQRLVDGRVADGDHLDRRRRGRPRPRRPPRAARRPRVPSAPVVASYSQARRSRSWARASRATVGGVAGVLLDQREGLQHRVVQVRGHVGALLGADPLGALLGQVAGEPEQTQGPIIDAPARRTAEQRRDHARRGPRATWPPRTANSTSAPTSSATPGAEPGVRRPAAAAEHRPDRVDPAGVSTPALALRLVGLPPQHPDPDHGEQQRPRTHARRRERLRRAATTPSRARPGRPAGPASASRRIARRPAACPGGSAVSRARVPESSKGALGRQHQPEAGVEHDPEAARARSRPGTRRAPRAPGRRGAGRGRPRPRRSGRRPGCGRRDGADRGPRRTGPRRRAGAGSCRPQSSHSARPPPHEVDP